MGHLNTKPPMNEECRTKHKVTYWHFQDPKPDLAWLISVLPSPGRSEAARPREEQLHQ